MKDLIECAVPRDDLQRWLDTGTASQTIRQGEKGAATLVRLGKSQSVDYLYRIALERDNSVSWNNNLIFCGVYDTRHRALYATPESFSSLSAVQIAHMEGPISSMSAVICDKINRRVEDIIANNRNNLPVREVTGWSEQRELQYYQEHGAREDAVQQFFKGEIPDGQLHSTYKMDGLLESAFIAYLQDPEGFVKTEAETYIKNNQESLLLQFLKNDALLAEYQKLAQDTDGPIHRMKAITDAVHSSGAKSVTVTVQKDGQELTFKTAADSITGCRNYYSTYSMPAPDRREFERMFGRSANFGAEDIVRITYARNTIYEAPPAQAENMTEEIGMGGMQFG